MLATRLNGVWLCLRVSRRNNRLASQIIENKSNDAFNLTPIHPLTSPTASPFHQAVKLWRRQEFVCFYWSARNTLAKQIRTRNAQLISFVLQTICISIVQRDFNPFHAQRYSL